jgi:predicted transcriptional regulator/DNA-binding XRE family transcriptional regulator
MPTEMTTAADRKLYLGPRLRVLRRELGLNQTQMAEELGVSPSYLNHLERNQRPLTALMLVRLASTYDLDLREFVAGANEAAASDLHQVFADDLLRDIGIPRHEVLEVAENYPSVTEGIARLYRALSDLRHVPDRVERLGASKLASPLEWLNDWLDQRRNHFPEIDGAAERLSAELAATPAALQHALPEQLKARYGIATEVVPPRALGGSLRYFNYHRRRLMLSELLPAASRLFGVAYQFAIQALGDEIDTTLARAAPPDDETARLAKLALVNYAAAAVLMPYAEFARVAEECRYDIDLLCGRFNVSLEQVAHRLTTLGRQGARGVPFFLLRIDTAGNVSKRLSADAMAIARLGGSCARWGIHRALHLPGETVVRLVEMPDQTRLLTFARALPRHPAAAAMLVLGCEAKYARRVLYADLVERDNATPIGAACHICERPECPDRALPPVTRALDIHQYQRGSNPFPFRAI